MLHVKSIHPFRKYDILHNQSISNLYSYHIIKIFQQIQMYYYSNKFPLFFSLPNGAGGKKTEELSKYFVRTRTKTIRSSFLPPAPVFLFPILFDKC